MNAEYEKISLVINFVLAKHCILYIERYCILYDCYDMYANLAAPLSSRNT